MKALVGAFNQEKALVGAFSVIVQPVVEPMEQHTALHIIQIFGAKYCQHKCGVLEYVEPGRLGGRHGRDV